MSARATASICCSPPLRLPACYSAPLGESGKHPEPALDVVAHDLPVACGRRRPPRGSPAPSARGRCLGPAARGRHPCGRSTRSPSRRTRHRRASRSPSCRPCRTALAASSSCRLRSRRAARRPRPRLTSKSRPCRTGTCPYDALRSVDSEHGCRVTQALPR